MNASIQDFHPSSLTLPGMVAVTATLFYLLVRGEEMCQKEMMDGRCKFILSKEDPLSRIFRLILGNLGQISTWFVRSEPSPEIR